MAARAVALIAGGAVLLLIGGPILAVLGLAGAMPAPGEADWQALRFTLVQAVLSAAFSVALAMPVARALARRRFWGRPLLVTLLGAPFILPTIVAVLGLVAVFGQRGLLNTVLGAAGLPEVTVYGGHGVVIAHVFFNLPLATRMILQGWLALPQERLRLSAQLGLSPWMVFRVVEVPMLARVVPQALAVIFVICLSSFAIALTLGGGPKATTLELAIYQALRFDFDIARAAMLALIQLGLALGAGLLALRFAGETSLGAGLDRTAAMGAGGTARLVDGFWLVAAGLFLFTPLLMVVLDGLPAMASLGAGVWRAAMVSVGVALASTVLCLVWALPLANRSGEWIALGGIALSPLVLGIGLYLIFRPYVRPADIALPATVTLNALAALPFCVRLLRPEAQAIRADFSRLSESLNLSGWVWMRKVYLPRLRRPLGFSAGLTAALSMGDLGVIALFADSERATLPLQIYRLMTAYRMDQAASAALLLLGLSLLLFWVFDLGGRADA